MKILIIMRKTLDFGSKIFLSKTRSAQLERIFDLSWFNFDNVIMIMNFKLPFVCNILNQYSFNTCIKVRKKSINNTNFLFFTSKFKLMSSIAYHGPANATRGHKKRLFVQLSNCPARTNFLNNRVASTWNNLASSTVNAPTLNSFKARLDIHLARTNTTTT
ncbi:hypothetical protein BpHYR1_005296 [Brachionus plicatilis]|uniref:RNA-directed DNA polymerase from mobile element jockey-like n=1 Tax=Brachionus plicatilis TaxID=10195 RepID=A0A3M7S5Y0_BRAPC|nr:hypothetical protein BpHYR1_005296 [Brachionus plicatilis]